METTPRRLLLFNRTAWAGVAALVAFTLLPGHPQAATGTAYTLKTVALLDAPGGQAIGAITPGTAVTAGVAQNGATAVTIEGFATGAGSPLLYVAAGQRVVLVSALDGAAAKLASTGAAQTVAGTAWQPVAVQGFVASSGLGSDVAPVWKAAQSLYAARCSSCHALPAVSAYTANAWPGMVKAMIQNAGLTADQTDLITKYLQTKNLPRGA